MFRAGVFECGCLIALDISPNNNLRTKQFNWPIKLTKWTVNSYYPCTWWKEGSIWPNGGVGELLGPDPSARNLIRNVIQDFLMETRETGHHRTRRSRQPIPPLTCSDLHDPDRPKYNPRFSPPFLSPTEIRSNKENILSNNRQYRRGTDKEAERKDAETWDRYQEARGRESDRSYKSRAAPGYDTRTRNYLNWEHLRKRDCDGDITNDHFEIQAR